jgi:hypothetical protein
MFSFGLAKLIFLVGILLVVIYGSRLLRHVQALRAAEDRRRAEGPAQAGAREGAAKDAAAGDIEDMVKCRACGAYVPARGARACGQPNCPFGASS